MAWSRPAGPPRIWSTHDLNDLSGRRMRFIIQEIPQDRYEEAVENMCTKFVKDEAMTSSCNIIDDLESMAVFRVFWTEAVAQGISIVAYEQCDNSQLVLAGLNILGVSEGKEDKVKDDAPLKFKKVLTVIGKMSAGSDVQKMFQVDRYLSAYGLFIDPKYRGLGLGKLLLKTRDKIGQAYDISITSTVFTSAVSQSLARRVGFEDIFVRSYDDLVDDKGEPLFPALKGKEIKVMAKRLKEN